MVDSVIKPGRAINAVFMVGVSLLREGQSGSSWLTDLSTPTAKFSPAMRTNSKNKHIGSNAPHLNEEC
jgi:hypothetical protein